MRNFFGEYISLSNNVKKVSLLFSFLDVTIPYLYKAVWLTFYVNISKVYVNKDVNIPINSVPWNSRNLILPSI